MSDFLPGLELSRRYYTECVRPILAAEFPNLAYSAALFGDGSEVLGFDTPLSADHDWGLRLLVFLTEEDHTRFASELDARLNERLPSEFLGYPTRFALTSAAEERHRIRIETMRGFVRNYLAFDLNRAIEPADWLTFPEQKLRALTVGTVFHDGSDVQAVRDRFAYYPNDVWLYLLAAGWNRIGQEEHLMGRAGSVGDEIGSSLIGARLVRDLMRLCFLMERQYAPYPKWFGTAFQRLTCAAELSPSLRLALQAPTWQERETPLCRAYELVAAKHNALGITEPLPTTVGTFFDRPFRVIHLVGGFMDAILAQIENPKALGFPLGGIDQLSDNVDLLTNPVWRSALRRLYEPDGEA